MSLIDDNRDIYNLIRLSSAGMQIADFPQIKSAIVEKYKQTFGSDIDIENTTADGIFIEDMSLLIFNILQSVKLLYANLDINNASGTYLDSLCALSAIYRKNATQSVAQLEIVNLGESDIVLNRTNNLQFVDKSGMTWSTKVGINELASQTITLSVREAVLVNVYCDTYGPIRAPRNWIAQLISNDTYTLSISQPKDAILGAAKEDDATLRSRRNQIISSSGTTVLSNLQGALLNLSGIKKVFIYNITNGAINALDGTPILDKSIYVVIAKQENVIIDDSIIGSLIFEKLTPGIITNQFNENIPGVLTPNLTGIGKSFDYYQMISFDGQQQTALYENKIYWKECTPISGITLDIKLQPTSNFAVDSTPMKILNTLFDYLYNLDINKIFYSDELISEGNSADPYFNGVRTYLISSIVIDDNDRINKLAVSDGITTFGYQYQAKDTYFALPEAEDGELTITTDPNTGFMTLHYEV